MRIEASGGSCWRSGQSKKSIVSDGLIGGFCITLSFLEPAVTHKGALRGSRNGRQFRERKGFHRVAGGLLEVRRYWVA